MYIDDFDDILGNPVLEDSLLHYAQDSSFNYLCLYDLHSLNFSDEDEMDDLASFISRARQDFGIVDVGAVGETYTFFQNKIKNYNNSRTNSDEKFNVFNLEFEFWVTSSVEPGGYYCDTYLQQANCDCDTAGAFQYYIGLLHKIDSLAQLQNTICETYVGWFNQGQGQQIQQNSDRILLHAYRTSPSSVFSYSKTRLSYLAANNQEVYVAPIFSAQPSFMGPWMEDHSQAEAFDQYEEDFDNYSASWKQYINLIGYQWFDWEYMPKPVSGATSIGPAFDFNDTGASLAASIYPNPAHDQLGIHVHVNAHAIGEISVMDLQGKNILTRKEDLLAGDNKVALSLENLEAGMYLLQVRTNEGTLNERIIIQ